MKSFALPLLVPLLFSSLTHARWRGFNLAAQRPEGGCKTQSDWESDFRAIKSLPGNFGSARLYASSDCDTLVHAVPASFATGVKILAGVWSQNADHFNAEKVALLAAVKQYGRQWLVAVSVGSEDLYRKETTGDFLAGQINDVRRMLASVGAEAIWVGHVDTWTTWVKPENAAVSFHISLSFASFFFFRLKQKKIGNQGIRLHRNRRLPLLPIRRNLHGGSCILEIHQRRPRRCRSNQTRHTNLDNRNRPSGRRRRFWSIGPICTECGGLLEKSGVCGDW